MHFRSAKKLCPINPPTEPAYQINVFSTSILVKREVFVYDYIHNRGRKPACAYSYASWYVISETHLILHVLVLANWCGLAMKSMKVAML